MLVNLKADVAGAAIFGRNDAEIDELVALNKRARDECDATFLTVERHTGLDGESVRLHRGAELQP